MKHFFLLFCLLLACLSCYSEAATKGFTNSRKERLLLITGCARSGTAYIAQVLQKAGLRVNHEADGKDGSVSWPMAAETENSPWGPGSRNFKFRHIFHQVRDPLKTIASASNELPASWVFICRQIPKIKLYDSDLVKAAKYWYYWNKLAERKAEWTYRVEDIELVWDELCTRLGMNLDKKAIKKVPKNVNTRHYSTKCTWEQLRNELDPELFSKITKLAARYGYPIVD